jgi:hypothetical protein
MLAHFPPVTKQNLILRSALSSFPYTPEYSMRALKYFYYDLGNTFHELPGNTGGPQKAGLSISLYKKIVRPCIFTPFLFSALCLFYSQRPVNPITTILNYG